MSNGNSENQERLANSHFRTAWEKHEAGDADGALWEIERAIEMALDP